MRTGSPDGGAIDLTGMTGFLGFFVSAGLVNAAIVALLLCRLPDGTGSGPGRILARATIYVVVDTLAGVAGAYLYWRRSGSPFRRNPPLAFRQFAVLCAAGWVWVPAAVLLSAQDSAATGVIGALVGVLIAMGLRKAIPAAAPAESADFPEGREMFSATLYSPPLEAHGYVISVCLFASFYALHDHSNLAAAALLATSGFLFAWNKVQPPVYSVPVQARQRAGRELARAAILAILVTAWALMLGVAHRDQAAATQAAFAHSRDNGTRDVAQVAPGSGPGGFESIILWPLLPKKQIIPRVPVRAELLGQRRSRPLLIRFDGNYWYFQPPETQPSRKAHQAHGTPLGVDIQANNSFPLTMEAHQRLIAPIKLARCRELDVSLQNRDNLPGSLSVAVLLGDSDYPGKPRLYLGQQPLESSQPGHFSFKRLPVPETLRFAIPAGGTLRKFDEITVMLLPDVEHAMVGPKVAVEQFEIVPR